MATATQALNGYTEFFHDLKQRIQHSQIKAALKVNTDLIMLYWDVGNRIIEKQKESDWGDGVLDQLSTDLRVAFPQMKGFSRRNLFYMKQFAQAYSKEIVQQLAAQIPWGHNMLLINKLEKKEERLFYAKKTLENGWSRNVLDFWIGTDLYSRQGKAITNFKETLPGPQSDLALQTMKDPYCFDFLALAEGYREKELEQGLMDHIQQFMLELGSGYAFVGRQYPLRVGDEDFYIDLLFYNLQMRCYCIIELKNGEFRPEYAGKMNFYLSAVDELLRHPEDRPSMGMILCKGKKKLSCDYALRDINKPIGVADFETKMMESLPEELKGKLPTVEELESHLDRVEG